MVVPFTGAGACAVAIPAPAAANSKSSANFPQLIIPPNAFCWADDAGFFPAWLWPRDA
jgi:hypothetical protein